MHLLAAMNKKCDGCGGIYWRKRESRLYAPMTYYVCLRCDLAWPSVWPPARTDDLVRLAHLRRPRRRRDSAAVGSARKWRVTM